MFKTILLIFFVIIFSSCFSSCNKKADDNTKADLKTKDENNKNSLTPKQIKGMYEFKDKTGILTDCTTGAKYLIAQEGDIKVIDSVYQSFEKNNPAGKLYVSAEGFNSVRENLKGDFFDTVLVITRLIGIDTSYNCQK